MIFGMNLTRSPQAMICWAAVAGGHDQATENMERLETERLILDKWSKKDARDLFAYASTPNVGPLAGWKPHESVAESKMRIKKLFIPNGIWKITLKEGAVLAGSSGEGSDQVDVSFAESEDVKDRGDSKAVKNADRHKPKRNESIAGRAIGSIGFEADPRRPEIKARELGYSLAEDYWGMGLMTEAGRAVIDYGFSVMGLRVISIETAPDNLRSQRVIEKLGFKYEGRLRDSYLTIDEKVRDTLVYSILRSEWETGK